MLDAVLAWLAAVPGVLIYAGVGAAAAIENVLPALPADMVVIMGGVVAATGAVQAGWVFFYAWAGSVASALAMYWVGRTRGSLFFEVGWGRHVLSDAQMERMARFFCRWGVLAVFLTRFLPGLRAVVPVFAGVSRQGLLATAAPIGLASGIWYGALVWLGAATGRNLDRVVALVAGVNRWLLLATFVVACAAAVWWWRTRHHG